MGPGARQVDLPKKPQKSCKKKDLDKKWDLDKAADAEDEGQEEGTWHSHGIVTLAEGSLLGRFDMSVEFNYLLSNFTCIP
jgi:hypothetical protein